MENTGPRELRAASRVEVCQHDVLLKHWLGLHAFSLVSFGPMALPKGSRDMRTTLLTIVLLLLSGRIHSQSPAIDYHQHLLSPSAAALGSLPTTFTARDLIPLFDAAGVHRALILSLAYQSGNPNRPPVPDEYTKVRAENDWTVQQVAQYPDRLRAFCGIDPLKDYALAEIARCAKDPYLHFGLKLHFGNSDVDLDQPQQVAKVRAVFQAADEHGMPIVVHLHSSVTRHRPYGAKEARTFLNEVLPAAPHVPVQIAHLAGSGGYDDSGVDEALSVFIDAMRAS